MNFFVVQKMDFVVQNVVFCMGDYTAVARVTAKRCSGSQKVRVAVKPDGARRAEMVSEVNL